jgi:hypothetical protein
MFLFREKVFQGVVIGAASPVAVYTLPQYDLLLGLPQFVAFEMLVSDVVGSPTSIQLDVHTSNTGNYWLAALSQVVLFNPSSVSGGGGITSSELANMVRGAIYLTGANLSASVLVYATGRAQQSWHR